MFGRKRWVREISSLVLATLLLGLSLVACGTGSGGSGSASGTTGSSSVSGNIETPTVLSTPTETETATAEASPTGSALTVTSIAMSVSPKSLNSYTCGTNLTVTYTAVFHFPADNPGGQVAFSYTTNNGQSQSQDSVTVSPGQTHVSYQFTWSGALPEDHTQPGQGGVNVTSPNSITSPMVAPSGSCQSAGGTAFTVSSVQVVASPSLSSATCGSAFTEKYTATFTIPANTPGGTIVFTYSTDNGRSNSPLPITLNVAAGQTSATYVFYWKGKLPADYTQPGVGLVLVTAPNQVNSTGGVPDGKCQGGN